MTGGTRDHKLNSTLKKNSAAPYYTPLHFYGEEKWIATMRNSGGETESAVSPLRFQSCSLFCLLRSPLFFRASVRPGLPNGRAPLCHCGNACLGTFVLRAIAVPVQRPEKVWRRSSVFTERRWGISWRGIVRIAVKSAVCIVSVAENKQAAARASSVTGLQFFLFYPIWHAAYLLTLWRKKGFGFFLEAGRGRKRGNSRSTKPLTSQQQQLQRRDLASLSAAVFSSSCQADFTQTFQTLQK